MAKKGGMAIWKLLMGSTMRDSFTPGLLKAFICECTLFISRGRANVQFPKLIWSQTSFVTNQLMRLGFYGTHLGKHCPMYPLSISLLNLHDIT